MSINVYLLKHNYIFSKTFSKQHTLRDHFLYKHESTYTSNIYTPSVQDIVNSDNKVNPLGTKQLFGH